MLVLGIDPGTATTGFGLIKDKDGVMEVVNWGLIETDKESLLGKRFINIYSQVSKLIKEFKPDVVAMEKIFFATNAKTAISVGQAQGVMIYCFAKSNLEVFEYAPGTIKKVVAGDGKAKKKDIQRSLRTIFGSKIRSAKKKKSHFDDSADALAVALCHILSSKYKKGGEKNV
ncbi:MAG: crossover junction endodeoxyribonuclease RuvC [Patescibacteria group bacterium]|nr:MAG: crossover junction endodeoxyribonuclease RuvC [Patescibacteria group bacterium]